MKNYFKIILGNLLITSAYAFITVPNKMINGGVTSFSMIVSRISGIQVALLADVFTVVLLFCCWLFLGKDYFLSAIFSSLCYISMFTLFHSFSFVVHLPLVLNLLLAAIMVGSGYYFCISAKSTAVGFDTVAIILKKYRPETNLAWTMWLINNTVLLLGLMTYGVVSVITGVAFTFIQAYTLNFLLRSCETKS